MSISDSVFEDSAATFAASIDEQIERNAYSRGKLFAGAVSKWVAAGGQVLDYGCGPGRISRLLACSGYRVLGVDPAAAMIGKAREQGPVRGLRFALLSSEDTELAVYDAIVCSSVIEYVPDPRELLLRFWSILRTRGKLILSFANARSLCALYGRWRAPDAPHRRIQRNVWTLPECEEMLQSAGFRIIDGPHFFDSPFDQRACCSPIARSELVGTLGLIVAEANERPVR